MAKKKKVYDPETGDVITVDQNNQPIAITELVQGFCDTFKPCNNEDEAEEVYTIGRLREYFQAFTMPGSPDVLPEYLNALGNSGFRIRTSYAGEPAIFVKWDNFPIKP